ncbi:coenzyme Q-binding protein COQ10 homolog B, mitochondrial [Arctopsyche grandis]|uniref:coenzyme Q-binding protein COQ10 homolog B, mitochondrial n=1 Tax=Arctopsyche grandis TaxID=121162 RepID=UPI00406D9136
MSLAANLRLSSPVAKAALRSGATSTAQTLIVHRRPIFDFTAFGNTNKQYARRKLVGYSMEQMYLVVSDVENYKTFVPWCQKSLVSVKEKDYLKANLIIGFPPINEQYTSEVTMLKPHLVRAECTEGRLFDHLLTLWRFSPGIRSQPQSCLVDFQVSFQFRSSLHSKMANLFFDKVVLQMEEAFIEEVYRRYGKATIPTQIIMTSDTIKA